MNLKKIADFVNSTINEFYEEMQNDPDEYFKNMHEKIKNMDNKQASVLIWQMLENAQVNYILSKHDNIQK